MILVNLAGFHVAIEPTVDCLEGNPELLCELRLTEFVFEAIDVQLVNQVLRHGIARL